MKKDIINFLNEMSNHHDNLPQYITGPKKNADKNNQMPNVLYSGPVWDQDEIAAILESVISGKWLSSGENVRKFERMFSREIGVKDSVMVNSGSSANLVMIAALKKYFGWNDGDEIIISVVGFPTTLNPIIQNGLVPVFVDISWDDLNWDLDEIEKKITDKTVGVFSSPVLGNMYDLDRLKDICTSRNIAMIGDNCDSLGTKWKGKQLAKYFVASSCSFYPAHHITTGEGGMVSSDITEIVQTARSFAWWGRDCYCVGAANLLSCGTCGKRFDKWINDYDGIIDHKYLYVNVGYNLKPLDLQGAVGIVQLKKLKKIHESRRKNKKKIQKIFEKINGIRIPTEDKKSETSWFGVPIICETNQIKMKLVSHLEKNGIQTRNYFAGNILMQPAYNKLDNFKKYPVANQVLDRVFFVGCSPNYTSETFGRINNAMENYNE